jgi:predicted glycosyltransferase
VQYTGFVVGPATSPAGSPEPGTYAVLSCGGNTKSTPFLLHAIEAFRRLSVAGALGSMPLYVFPGPGPRPGDVAALRDATRSGPFRLFDFSPDFDGWLAGSALSISRCGYNTAVQLLSSRVRSVVVPNPDNSDQDPRARRLGKLGLATVVEGATPPLGVLAAAIEDALARPPLEHDLDLGGVAATRAILEELVRGAASGAPR